MKKFEIEMDIHFTKTVHIDAPDEDAATVLAETMLLCTDALPLTDADMVGLITTATELDKKPVRKSEPVDEDEDDEEDECFCCGDCTICGICDEEEEFSAGADEDTDREDRIDELLEKLEDALEDFTDSMSSLVGVARALRELTGEDIFSQLMR